MEELSHRLVQYFWPGTDIQIPWGGFNTSTVVSTIVVMAVLWFFMFWAARGMSRTPGRGQMVLEMFITAWEGLVASLLDERPKGDQRRILPIVACLFMFIMLSNAIIIIPIHGIEKPTTDLNLTLGLALMSLSYATYSGIRVRGVGGYLEELCGPMFHQHDAKGMAYVMGKLSGVAFFPLHVLGELAKIVSLSFRLFGNILGAAIIIIVVFELSRGFFTPLPMYAFFLVFEAFVQAFVFSMLTLIYTAVAVQ